MTKANLPPQPTPFIGREHELAEIARLLADPACRLLTLVGPGGMGKTRLAIEAARQLPLPEGSHFVPLQPLTSPDFIVPAIAAALDIQFYQTDDPKQQLLNILQSKSMLLLLDNFEHLLDGVGLLPEILAAAPAIKLFVTSRERLNLQEEWAYTLDGLSFPEDTAADALESFSAAQLFSQRARQVEAHFSLDKNTEAVTTICQQLEGLPLGLELAASWLRAMSCEQVAAHMQGNLNFLATPLRNLPARHRSLNVVFEQSWNMLTGSEQAVLMRLSVFHGGFDLEAAEQVADASPSLLAGLIDKSLIRLNASGRYDIHELLRQYAADKLVESSESAATEGRHFAFLLSLAEEASQHDYYQAEKPWLDRLEVEHDNFRAALGWSLRNKEAELGLHLAGILAWFWRKRFYGSEGRVWLEKMLANSSKTPSASLAKALYFAGLLISDLGDNHQAKRLAEQAVTVARTVGDEATIAWSLSILGHITRIVEGGRQSAVLLEEALNLFRELGDVLGVTESLRTLGRAMLHQHNTEQAAMLLEESLGLSRVAGAQISIAHNLCLLGNIACHQNNNLGRAGVLFQESLSLFKEARDILGMTESFLGLASVARMQRDYQQARRFYKESLATTNSEMGYNYSVAEALWGLGAVARAEGDYEQSQTLYQKALILNKGLDTWDTAYCLAGLGGLEMVRKEPQRAARLLGAAAVLFEIQRDLYTADRIAFERDVAAARAHLGEVAFVAAWAAGQAMTLEQAIAYALEGSTTALEVALSEQMDDSDMTQHRQAANRPVIDPLTTRELDILRLMSDGLNSREIAEQLVLSVGTVRWYLKQIYSKLDVHGRSEAIARARELKLLA